MRASASGGRITGLLLAWLAGVAGQLHERKLLPLSAYVAACAGAALLFATAWIWRRASWRGPALAVIAAGLAGFSLTGWQASERLRDALRPELEGRDLVNAMSCVLRVSGGGRSVLLVGDIEREQEVQLVAAQGGELRSDVQVVPHHGSRTSSSPAFIDAVQPWIAVFQAGYRNRFGHPAPDVLARYRSRGVAIIASPACGAWQWLAAGPAGGRCERDVGRRYRHYSETATAG